jgi:hypothetical protein
MCTAARVTVIKMLGGEESLGEAVNHTLRPIIVCSFPKAGTYLVAELLKRLGVKPTGFHLMVQDFSDYSFASIDEARNRYQRFTSPRHLLRSCPSFSLAISL